MKTSKLTGAMAGIAMLAGAQTAIAADSITIAYFTEWAMPFEYAKQKGDFEKAMGVKINWRAFDTGTAMSAAMASGDVQLSISQGVPPFIVATSAGQDLQAVDVAVSYSGNDNCVVSDKLEITGKNAKELEGKKAAVPIGTAAQYDFLKQMEHFGVDASKVQVVDMAPADGAAALAQGNVDMACGFGGGLQRMEEHGHVLMTGDEKDAIGLHVYDVISAPSEFVGTSPELVTKFLKVVHEMNDKWNSGAAAQTEMLPVIAKDAGMDLPAAKKMMAGFKFLSTADTLGPVWMGGGVQKNLKDVADFFVSTGNVKKALSSYDDRVNAGPLKATSAM
jgi:taurine transport system substrate-binding protein